MSKINIVPLDQIGQSGATTTPTSVPLDTVNMYRKQTVIDPQKFDTLYQRTVAATLKPEGAAGVATDVAAGAMVNVGSFVNEATAAGLVITGNILDDTVDKSGFITGPLDVARRATKNRMFFTLPAVGPAMSITMAVGQKASEAFASAREQIQANEGLEREDGTIDASSFLPRGRSWREDAGKRLALWGLTSHLREKKFRQALDPAIDSQLAFDVGGGLASFSRTILLGMVNPALALAAMTGEVSSQKFLEAREAGVDFVPSLTFAAVVGGTIGQMERVSLGILKARTLKFTEVVGKSIILNAIEESAQGAFERGMDKAIGLRVTGIWEDVRDVLYEGLIGGIVGGVGGATVVTHARKRVHAAVEESLADSVPDPRARKKAAGQLAKELMAMEFDVGTSLIHDLMENTESDLDAAQALLDGEGDATENLRKLDESMGKKVAAKASGETVGVGADQVATALGEEIAGPEGPPMTAADEKLTQDLIIKEKALREGREAQLDQERIALEKEMTFIEQDIEQRKETGKPTKQLETKLVKLSSQLEALHFQLADLIDDTVRQIELDSGDIKIKGAVLERVRKAALETGERGERQRLNEAARVAKANDLKLRDQIVKYARKYLPPSKRGTVLADLRKPKITPAGLRNALRKIDTIREASRREHFLNRVNEALVKLQPVVGRSGQEIGKFKSAQLQAAAKGLVTLAQLTPEEAAIRKVENNEALQKIALGEPVSRTRDEIFADTEMVDLLADFENKSSQGLEDAARFLEGTFRSLRDTGDFIKRIQKETQDQTAQQIVSEVSHPNMVGGDEGKFQALRKMVQTVNSLVQGAVHNYSTSVDLLIRAKDKETSAARRHLIDNVELAQRQSDALMTHFTRQISDMYRNAYGLESNKAIKEQQARDVSLDPKDGAFVEDVQFLDGTVAKVSMSMDMLRYWYAISHNTKGEQNADVWEVITGQNALNKIRQKIEEGEIQEDSAEHRAALKQVRGNQIPIEVFTRMMQQVEARPKDMQFIREQRAFYGRTYPMINPVYRRMFATDLPQVGEYIPWAREFTADQVFSPVDDLVSRFKYLPGFTKVRQKGAMAAFRQMGDMDVLNHMALELSHFLPFYPAVSDTVALLKHPDVRRAINLATDGRVNEKAGRNEQVQDGRYYKNLINMLEMIGTRGRRHLHHFHGLVQGLNNNLSRSALGLKGTIGGIQVTSSLLAMDYVTPTEFVSGIQDLFANPKEAIALLRKSPSFRMRDGNFMIELQDISRSFKKKQMERTLSSFDTALFFMVQQGNRAGIVLGGWSVFRATYNKTGDINKAYERFDSFMTSTQQSSNLTEMSLTQASGWRLILKFLSQPIQILRKEMLAVDDALKGRITPGEALRKIAIYHFILPALVEMIRAMFLPEKKNLAISMIMGPTVVLPFFSDLVEGLIMAGMGERPFTGSDIPLVGSLLDIPTDLYRIRKAHSKNNISMYDLLDAYVELVQDTGAPLGLPTIFSEITQTGLAALDGDLPGESVFTALLGYSKYRINKRFNPEGGRKKKSGSLIPRGRI